MQVRRTGVCLRYLLRCQLGTCLKIKCCFPGCQLSSTSSFQRSVTAGSVLSQLLLFASDLLIPAVPAHTSQDSCFWETMYFLMSCTILCISNGSDETEGFAVQQLRLGDVPVRSPLCASTLQGLLLHLQLHAHLPQLICHHSLCPTTDSLHMSMLA